MKTLNKRLGSTLDHFGNVYVSHGRQWSQSKLYRRSQGIARLYGKESIRNECTSDCRAGKVFHMPKVIASDRRAPGEKSGAKSKVAIEWLLMADDDTVSVVTVGEFVAAMVDPDGEFYSAVTGRGLLLTEGEDYRLADGKSQKSLPSRVSKELKVEFARSHNVPTTVQIPVKGEERNWVAFRPRFDSPFPVEDDGSSTERDEYIARNR